MTIDYSGRTKQRSNTRIRPFLGTMFFASLSLSVLFDVFKMKIVFHIWDTLQKRFDAIDEYFEALKTKFFSVAEAVMRKQNLPPCPKYR